MLFNSGKFIIFFPIVVLMYFILPKKTREYWLLVSSYYFYACWNAKYLLLLFTSTLVTYLSALVIDRENGSGDADRAGKRKKLILVGSIVINLAILFYFKYTGFALSLLHSASNALHVEMNVPAVDILLPVGISFYSFQALGYAIDVYRGDIGAEHNFFRYALFVSFFPQLVAGPIERSGNLLGQLSESHRFDFDNFREGLLLMLWGFFLKLVIADRFAIFVDKVYDAPYMFEGWYLIVATVLFAFQIYCDFYGYSTIAAGCAKVLGIELMDNFKAPYLSGSVAEFWRNWHISLTSWFRDYLYIPLGGSRKGKLRKYLNIMIVFLTSGLWHGADLSYIVWGGLNGAYQVIGDMLKPLRDRTVKLLRLNRESFGHRLMNTLVTAALILPTWVFFRADSISKARGILSSIVHASNPWILLDGSLFLSELDNHLMLPLTLCMGVLLLSDICKKRGIVIRKAILRQDFWFRWLTFTLSIAVILTLGVWGPGFSEANFIYFQF